jgi:hypothetical protein
MDALNDEVARKAREMTRREIVLKAVAGLIAWAVAATCLGVTERHMRRIRDKYERFGVDVAVQDGRAGGRRARRVPLATLERLTFAGSPPGLVAVEQGLTDDGTTA